MVMGFKLSLLGYIMKKKFDKLSKDYIIKSFSRNLSKSGIVGYFISKEAYDEYGDQIKHP